MHHQAQDPESCTLWAKHHILHIFGTLAFTETKGLCCLISALVLFIVIIILFHHVLRPQARCVGRSGKLRALFFSPILHELLVAHEHLACVSGFGISFNSLSHVKTTLVHQGSPEIPESRQISY